MLKRLLIVLCIFNITFAMEEGDEPFEGQEEMSITDYEDIWFHVADFLDGNDLFLNMDIARNIKLDKENREKIIRAFLKSLEFKDKADKLEAIRIFFNTSHLKDEDNLLKARFKNDRELIEHWTNCRSIICSKCKSILDWSFSRIEPQTAVVLKKHVRDTSKLKYRHLTLCMCIYPVIFSILILMYFRFQIA